MSAFSCVPRGDVRNEKLQNPQLKAFKKTLEINNQFNLNPDLGLIKTFVLLMHVDSIFSVTTFSL